MALVHHFPNQANAVNAWIAKSASFDPRKDGVPPFTGTDTGTE